MSRLTRNAKPLQKKSRSHQVTQINVSTFSVTSGASGKIYQVVLTGPDRTHAHCNCNWGRQQGNTVTLRVNFGVGGRGCSHVMAMWEFIERRTIERSLAYWTTTEDAERQHRPTRVQETDNHDHTILSTSRRLWK